MRLVLYIPGSILFAAFLYFFLYSERQNSNHRYDVREPQSSNYIVTGMPPNPPLVKAQGYPPTTEQAKAQWEWWHRMMKQDRGFQWRMPISFYGKVLDQFEKPVDDVRVDLQWTSDGDTPKRTIYTDVNGLFALEGTSGKRLSVTIFKKGYRNLRTGESGGSFEYADFSNRHFHVPDKNNPHIFKLQKLVDPEPLYQYSIHLGVLESGAPIVVGIISGEGLKKSDLSIEMKRWESKEKDQFAFDFMISTIGETGLIETKTDSITDTLAPEKGYKINHTHNIPMKEAYGREESIMFFVRTEEGKFARMVLTFVIKKNGECSGNISMTLNPSGSRNLEVDDALIIK